MSNNYFETDSIGNAWHLSLKHVLEYGTWYHDSNISILELCGLTIRINFPNLNDDKIMSYADNEVLERMLVNFNHINENRKQPFTYGERLYNLNNINQIEWLIARLKRKNETKSATISLLKVGDENKKIPCLTTIDAKIRFDKLDLFFFFRSNNVFGRQYANLEALVRLQYKIAKELNCKIGIISGFIASAHIYEFDILNAKAVVEGKGIKIIDEYYNKGPIL